MSPNSELPPTGAFAVVIRSGEILLIKRGTSPHKGFWCPPGGVIDEGESPEEAAVRENNEETGIEVDIVSFLGEVRGPMTGRTHNVYLCKQEGGELTSDSPEVEDVRWVPFADLHSYRIPMFIMDFLDTMDLHEPET